MKYNATLTEFFKAMQAAIQNGSFVKAALTQPTPTAGALKSIDIRPITVKRELKLSFTSHNKTNDIVKNYTPAEAEPLLAKLLPATFTQAKIFTLEHDILLTHKKGTLALTYHGATQAEAPNLSHDKPKHRVLTPDTQPWMHSLGLTDAHGTVLKSSQDKFRQINKYLEVLDGLVKQMPKLPLLRIADMGSGKGYLTFALYEHLTTNLSLKVEIIGVEYRDDMVALCNRIAQENNFTGLTFQQNNIADFNARGMHIVIALHACDTATDDALAKAVRSGAELIVAAPCCHKQVRRNLPKNTSKHPLHFLLKYGTYQEKLAEMLTDGLRAQLLELHNYSTHLFEFISGEHTPKNVMITALRNQQPLTADKQKAIQTAITEAKAHFGLPQHHLETLL